MQVKYGKNALEIKQQAKRAEDWLIKWENSPRATRLKDFNRFFQNWLRKGQQWSQGKGKAGDKYKGKQPSKFTGESGKRSW